MQCRCCWAGPFRARSLRRPLAPQLQNLPSWLTGPLGMVRIPDCCVLSPPNDACCWKLAYIYTKPWPMYPYTSGSIYLMHI